MLKTVMRVWGKNHSRCVQVVEKLWQMGILSSEVIVEHCLKNGSLQDTQLEFKLVKLNADRVFDQKRFLLTIYKQRGFLASLS